MKNRNFKKIVFATIVVVGPLGLLGFGAPAGAQDANVDAQSDAAQFAVGAQTWADNCDRCHNMRDPKEFRDDQWRAIVSHMRVRGGLTGQETRDVLAFLQGANDAPVTAPGLALAPVLPEADDESDPKPDGQEIYAQTCVACHGADGKGPIAGVPDFTAKESPLVKTDGDLLRNVSTGFQSPGSFMAMPAKGGNPALTEKDVKAVIAYLRSEFGK